MTLLTMSTKELNTLEVIQKTIEKRLSHAKAAVVLHLSERQVRRLIKRYKEQSASGLISKKRGKPSNHQLPQKLKEKALGLIKEFYNDFGPTLVAEKLREKHQIRLAVETIRQLMVKAGLWASRAERRRRIAQPRYRRECLGELIQIDGSEHPWFEDRAPQCTLLVYVDDATSRLMMLKFVPSESTFTYFEATKAYLRQHGKPIAFYSDKHTTFRVNNKQALGGDGITQFGRALYELNIDILCANTCQAKGRVERANKTLQDRLVKELRLRNISTVQEANAYLPEFMEDYNSRFAKEPLSPHNAHRPLRSDENLEEIFTWQEPRTLSNNLTLQYDKVLYLVKESIETRKLARKRITVVEYPDGSIKLKYENQFLPYSVFDKITRVEQSAIVDNKRLGAVLSLIRSKQLEYDERRSKSAPARRHLTSFVPPLFNAQTIHRPQICQN